MPYQDVTVDLLRSGQLIERLKLTSDGTGQVPRLNTEVTGYVVRINKGWAVLQGTFNLLPGPNFHELFGPEAIKLTGKAVYQNTAGGVPNVTVRINGAVQSADILADGYFEVDQVPVSQAVEVMLAKKGSARSFNYAGFNQDTDLGTLLLDGGPPVITPVAESME